MGEAKMDHQRRAVRGRRAVALRKVVEHLFAVPCAAGLSGAATFGGIIAHREGAVRGVVAIAHFAGAHGIIVGAIEDGRDGVLLEIRWAMCGRVGRRLVNACKVQTLNSAQYFELVGETRFQREPKWR
jgi:hypothetical protein